jgi:hypothetical protein
MADLVVTAAQVAAVFPQEARIRSYIAAATITAGQAVYRDSAGKANLADANGSGTLQFRGIALNGGGAGQAIDVLEEGEVYGFTIAGAYDSLVYLSNTAGALADAAGGTSVVAGRVTSLTDGSTLTKILYISAKMNGDWA